MGYRRSYKKRQETSFMGYLWVFIGLVALVFFFVLLNWLGIVLTGVLLGLLLCMLLGLRCGQPTRLFRVHTGILADRPATSGFRLPPAEVVRAEVQAQRSGTYGPGYQSSGASSQRTGPQPKEERPAGYEQPQAYYPQNMPPAP